MRVSPVLKANLSANVAITYGANIRACWDVLKVGFETARRIMRRKTRLCMNRTGGLLTMATALMSSKVKNRASPPMARLPRALRQRVEQLLAETYAYMDSPIFRQRNLEKELFSEEP